MRRATDELGISEVVRRRHFGALGSERVRPNVVRAYADLLPTPPLALST